MAKPKRAPKPNFPNTRKALRKQKRVEKKVKRKEHYSNKKLISPEKPSFTPGKFVKRPAEATGFDGDTKKKKPKPQPSAHEILNRERQKEKREESRLKSQMDAQRKKIFLKDNDDEDKIIKKLEKQLGLNKTKNKNRLFADDGLDYLLDICDRATGEQIVAAEKHLANVEDQSDFEEDLATVTGKKRADEEGKESGKETKGRTASKRKLSEGSDQSGSEDGSMEAEFSGGEDDDEVGDDDDELGVEEEEDQGSEDSGDSEEMDNEEFEEEQPKPKKNKKDTEEKKPEKLNNKANKTEKHNKKRNNDDDEDNDTEDEDLENPFSDDEVSHLSDDEDIGDDLGDEYDRPMESKTKEKPDVWEDIYGRKRDKEGNVIKEEKGVYIPPHLRNKDQSSDDKQMALIKRQIKSVLNKLSGSNLHWACATIEGLYSNHSRHSVNTSLSDLWLEAVVGPSATPDRMVCEHAALVSVLQANVGAEIGAHFLQILAAKFDDMMVHPEPLSDKKLDNLVSCLSHLYSFKMYHASLLYDILHRLLEDLTEKNIECILVALRSVGGVLRKEEPLALKNFIHETQGKVAKLNESAVTGSRIKFLLEILMAVKNNNLNKIPNYDPTYAEQLKKNTRTIVRKGNYVTPLNIRLEDLLKADERGKWWVVGSAWEGTRTLAAEPKAEKAVPQADQKLLEIARRQRMNTDVRRTIFCVIMAAEDFMDAFEKLQHLGLKGQQEREVVHVLLACCLQEKTYNPYYALLGQKLCECDRKYQLSIQYTVWDKIKDIENQTKQCLSNLAQFLTHLIMEKSLALSVLKVIEFSDLNKHSVKFMRQILLAIIMNEDLKLSLEVFHRISKPPKLQMFRESLRLFIQHFLIRNAGKKTSVLSEEEMMVLKERGAEVDKILTMHESKLRF